MTDKELKLKILNQVLVDLPKTIEESEETQESVYVCDHINNATADMRGEAYDVSNVLTDYIHTRIGGVFSVFELINADYYHDFDKAYEYRINMLNDMIRLVENDEL